MTSPSIFYSWQSDLPAGASRTIIAEALERCLPALASHPHVIESPRLDHDTQNVGGTPEIAGTIFRKIERSAVFVADVSITQKSTDACTNTKYGPNPNVLLETGYAAARLGWDRIVLAMNERFGGVSKLPFDLRNRRWPITFSVSNDAESTDAIVDTLANRLTEQIGLCFAADYTRAEDALAQLAPHARRLMRRLAVATAFNDGDAKNSLISRDDFHIQQMITLGLIRCVPDSTDLRSHMTWTYLGRECCRRIGIDVPVLADQPEIHPQQTVVVDNSAYDILMDEIDANAEEAS